MTRQDDRERALYREAQYLRELLTRVAQDLEHVAALTPEGEHRELLLRRAQRIRERVHQGPPDGWTAAGPMGSNREDES